MFELIWLWFSPIQQGWTQKIESNYVYIYKELDNLLILTTYLCTYLHNKIYFLVIDGVNKWINKQRNNLAMKALVKNG